MTYRSTTSTENVEAVAFLVNKYEKEIASLCGQLAQAEINYGLEKADHMRTKEGVTQEPFAWVKLNDESDFTFQKPVHEEGYRKLYAASIESKHWEIAAKQLGKQLDECERDLEFQTNARIQDAKDAEANCKAWAESKLASVTKERDEYARISHEQFTEMLNLKEQLAAMTKERDELLARRNTAIAEELGRLLRETPRVTILKNALIERITELRETK